MSEVIWEPTQEYIDNSNIKRLMDEHGIATYEELIERSTGDIEWFWPAMMEDRGVEWYREGDELYDMIGARYQGEGPLG